MPGTFLSACHAGALVGSANYQRLDRRAARTNFSSALGPCILLPADGTGGTELAHVDWAFASARHRVNMKGRACFDAIFAICSTAVKRQSRCWLASR